MHHIKFTQNSKNPDDWRTGFVARRHRVPRNIAREYLAWAAPRWERKA